MSDERKKESRDWVATETKLIAAYFEQTLRTVTTNQPIKIIRILSGTTSTRRAPTRLVQRPPAMKLDHLLRFFASKKTYECVYSQIVIDTREEYVEAIATGDERKARWIVARCYWSVLSAFLVQIPINLIAAIAKRMSGG